jgi:hypothetical protein
VGPGPGAHGGSARAALCRALVPFSLLRTLEPSTVGLIPAETWNWLVIAYEPSSRRSRTFIIPDSVLANDDGVVSYEVVVDGVVTSFSSVE